MWIYVCVCVFILALSHLGSHCSLGAGSCFPHMVWIEPRTLDCAAVGPSHRTQTTPTRPSTHLHKDTGINTGFKETVHLKMYILSSFTHPRVIPKPLWLSSVKYQNCMYVCIYIYIYIYISMHKCLIKWSRWLAVRISQTGVKKCKWL